MESSKSILGGEKKTEKEEKVRNGERRMKEKRKSKHCFQ